MFKAGLTFDRIRRLRSFSLTDGLIHRKVEVLESLQVLALRLKTAVYLFEELFLRRDAGRVAVLVEIGLEFLFVL
jgi:hypothetical protein